MTKEELENIAILSKLQIDEAEEENLLKDMENIIEFANRINLADVGDLEFEAVNNIQNVYREDEVLPSYPQEEILKNAKTTEEGFFYLKNVEDIGGGRF